MLLISIVCSVNDISRYGNGRQTTQVYDGGGKQTHKRVNQPWPRYFSGKHCRTTRDERLERKRFLLLAPNWKTLSATSVHREIKTICWYKLTANNIFHRITFAKNCLFVPHVKSGWCAWRLWSATWELTVKLVSAESARFLMIRQRSVLQSITGVMRNHDGFTNLKDHLIVWGSSRLILAPPGTLHVPIFHYNILCCSAQNYHVTMYYYVITIPQYSQCHCNLHQLQVVVWIWH